MKYKITRTKRKTMSLIVHKDGSLEVKCPKNLSEDYIKKFVESKQKWINDKVSIRKDRLLKREEFCIKPGSKLRFLGEYYPIAEIMKNKIGFDGKYFLVPQNLPACDIKPNIIKLYKMLAKNYITKRTFELAKVMQVSPTNVKINSATTRWGSCSDRNSINFSWRLIMASEKTVDYVIIHELAHTIEHNHSDNFWSIVEKYVPDYNEHINKLKELTEKLMVEDWD